jgi:hypothetical protein
MCTILYNIMAFNAMMVPQNVLLIVYDKGVGVIFIST